MGKMQTGKRKQRMSPDQLPPGQELCWWQAQTGEPREGGAGTDSSADSALSRGYQDKRPEGQSGPRLTWPVQASGRPEDRAPCEWTSTRADAQLL